MNQYVPDWSSSMGDAFAAMKCVLIVRLLKLFSRRCYSLALERFPVLLFRSDHGG
jgi:hypothetical protein